MRFTTTRGRPAPWAFLVPCLIFALCLAHEGRAASRHLSGYRYVSPLPGARFVSRWNNVIIRQGGIIAGTPDPSALSVTGSVSGRHDGSLVVSDDARTLVFTPRAPFAPGETVSVRMSGAIATRGDDPLSPLAFEFTVSKTDPKDEYAFALQSFLDDLPAAGAAPAARLESRSAPRIAASPADTLPFGYPKIVVVTRSNPESDAVFISPFTNMAATERGRLLVVDNYGMPLFYRSTERAAYDFRRLPDGRYTYFTTPNAYMIMDSTGAVVDSVKAGNGYAVDGHDLQLLPNGHWLLMAYDWQRVDMSLVVPGGDPDALVGGLIVQELDAARNVVFQWSSWDHIPITEMVDCAGSLTSSRIDYMHGNAVEEDLDGNILVSSRHLSQIIKIDRDTGDVIWQLGLNAKANDFTFLNDDRGFSMQHDIRRLPNGDITLFDNADCLSPVYSRAVEYALDEVNMTATMVWEYRTSPDTYGPFMGNVQRRDSQGTMIGWGGTEPDPKLTDLNPDGSVGLELGFQSISMWTYRAFRFPWTTTQFSVSPTLLHFGTVQTGHVKTRTFSVTNETPTDLVINGFGSTHLAYTVTDTVPIVIPPGGSADVHVQFTPFAGTDFTGAVYARAVNDTELIAAAVACDGTGFGSALSAGDALSPDFALHAGQPTPFQTETAIRFDLPRRGPVTLEVFDVRGRRVETLVDGVLGAGTHHAVWSAGALPDGVYFLRLSAGALVATRRTVLIR